MLILSVLGIWTACDVLEYADTAGGQPSKEALITIEPRQHLKTTADMLCQSEIIRKPSYFYLYARVVGLARRIQAGEYLLSGAMTPRQILEIMVSGKIFLHKITIPEGYNLKEIAAEFAAAGLASESLLLRAAKTRNFAAAGKSTPIRLKAIFFRIRIFSQKASALRKFCPP